MVKFNYYEAPSDSVFEELKAKAKEIWDTYDDTYGYASEKKKYIDELKNIQDNAWTIVGMFDIHNQAKLYEAVNEETRAKLSEVFTDYYLKAYKDLI